MSLIWALSQNIALFDIHCNACTHVYICVTTLCMHMYNLHVQLYMHVCSCACVHMYVVQIRAACFKVVVSLCKHCGYFISSHARLFCSGVLCSLGEREPGVVGPLWDAALLTINLCQVSSILYYNQLMSIQYYYCNNNI